MTNSTEPIDGTIFLQQSLAKQPDNVAPAVSESRRGFTFRKRRSEATSSFTMQKLTEEEVRQMDAVTVRNIYRNAGRSIF